ncbi:MAG: hypothetical protein PHD54_06470 [Desulfuromonadaceae bacterium]|nr:hypothetical protein [Desulfuromonadaceae bacterium]
MKTAPKHQEIVCQQALVDNVSVFSLQSTVFPIEITVGFSPEKLLERYLDYVRDCSLSIIRPLVLKTGIDFRFLGTNWSLISFLPPEVDTDSVTLQISGGVLVHPCQNGRSKFRFRLETVQGGVSVSLRLSEFCPRLLGNPPPSLVRFWLYRLTQAAIHRMVTTRFLTLLYRELAGYRVAVQVVDISSYAGQPV